MAPGYEATGRRRQKSRTREALVAAARKVLAEGGAVSIEGVAHEADVSRTTAYRYFPNLRSLLAAAHPYTDVASLLPDDPPDDPAERLDLVVRVIHRTVLDDEAQQRTMLRLSLDPTPHDAEDLPLRQGRAIPWLTEALEPVRPTVGDDGLRRLVLAIRSAIGVEALVWLVDVAGLSRRAATEQMRWTAQTLLRGALD